ncbi:unnamed protein product [Psylliodes chrysocephalus]|uniref:Uncharacterized protein n=1 Tax=Psylliodes chrysocephalus TaxID=3402493 RepID=A0A9P0CD68_9CUCU|nr:unnamed protein product [Psylliodes chrysocephala]
MSGTLVNVLFLKRSLVSFTHTVFIIIRNCIFKITSRRFVSKLLLRLPNHFFPRYRVLVSHVLVENNRKTRESVGYLLDKSSTSSNDTFTSSEDSSEEILAVNEDCYQCCKYCRTQYYIGRELPEYCTPSQIKTEAFTNATSTPCEQIELLLTPPLRKITPSELNSVKLRKSADFLGRPKTPELNDLLRTLRKRFAVMHSSVLSDTEGNFNDDDDDSCSFLVSSTDCIEIACS